jgi:DNA-directed RNA polymerase specialized sigma24 family protein
VSEDNDQPWINSVAAKAKLGDPAATSQLVKFAAKIGHQWLERRGVSQFHDREDIVQEVVIRLISDWDSKRSSAYTFLVQVLLPTARAQHFRALSEESRKVVLASSSNRENGEVVTSAGEEPNELLASLLRRRSSFLNLREKEAIRCHLSHPGWTDQQIASACGVNASVASVATRYKLPLELMNRWACSKTDPGTSDDLCNFLTRLGAWHRDGNSSLAATGLDILLAGFSAKHQAQTLTLLDGNGDPAILPIIVLRTQIALAQQELPLADRLLVWLDTLLHHRSLSRAQMWQHRLHYSRGRWHTAAFHYADALDAYRRAFEVPGTIWRGDPVFLHSVAVAYRGVQKFTLAEDFINQSLAVYAEQGRVADVAHTISRKARINMERGKSERRLNALTAAEDGLERVHTNFPDFPAQSPLGYVQYRLHRLRFLAQAEHSPDEIHDAVGETLTLINRGAYAHEFLELEEVCEQYNLSSKVHGLAIGYAPARQRFGQKRMARLRSQLLRSID